MHRGQQRRAGRVRRPAGQAGVTLVGFDQHGADIVAPGLTRQHSDNVVALARTQADQPYRARGCLVDGVAKV